MKHTIYITPEGIINLCTVPVPIEPKTKDYGYSLGTLEEEGGWKIRGGYQAYGQAMKQYEAALKHCKESSIPFDREEDQEKIKTWIWKYLPDTFYPVDVTVEIVNTCPCQLDRCEEPNMVARLVESKPENSAHSFTEGADVPNNYMKQKWIEGVGLVPVVQWSDFNDTNAEPRIKEESQWIRPVDELPKENDIQCLVVLGFNTEEPEVICAMYSCGGFYNLQDKTHMFRNVKLYRLLPEPPKP